MPLIIPTTLFVGGSMMCSLSPALCVWMIRTVLAVNGKASRNKRCLKRSRIWVEFIMVNAPDRWVKSSRSEGQKSSGGWPAFGLRVISEREELLQIVPRGLPAILADLEGLRVTGFPSPLLTVEFHQGIAVSAR